MDLYEFQKDHKRWLDHNFPGQLPHQPLLGVVEEVGELSHSFLKMEQGIRGSTEKHLAEAQDAVGDIIVYLASLCNTMGWDLDKCLREAWSEVRERDWQAHPETGGNWPK